MENKVLEENLKHLAQINPNLARKINSISDIKQNIELGQNENGEYNLFVNGFPLHSEAGAVAEAKNIVDKVQEIELENSVQIVYGVGLCYLLDEFITRTKGKIILFERNLEILRCALEMVDFTEYFEKHNLKIIDDLKDLSEILTEISDKDTKINVSFLNSYFLAYKEDIYKVVQEIEYSHGQHFAQEAMIMEVGENCILNSLDNLEKMQNSFIVSDFKNKGKGKVALVVGAGPSLSKNIEILKKHRDKFIIFSVGASYKTLKNNGITADFLFITEPRDTSGQLIDCDTSDTVLIAEPFTHTSTWNLNTKSKITFLSQNNFLNDWILKSLSLSHLKLSTSGTVTFMALIMADFMNFDKIVLLGQDLAYSDASCYAKGSAYEDLECIFDENEKKYKIVPKDKEKYFLGLLGEEKVNDEHSRWLAENYIQTLNQNLYTVKGQNGENLPTQTAYALFIKHHETYAKNNFGLFGKQIELINSSSGGAEIAGFKNIPLEKVADDIAQIQEKIEFPEKYLDISPIKNKKGELIEILTQANKDFEELTQLAQKAGKEYQRRKTITEQVKKLLIQLNEKNLKYKTKFNNYDNIVHYITLGIYKDFEKLIRRGEIKTISENLNIFSEQLNSFSSIIEKFKEKINTVL